MITDDKERQKALDPSKSFIVQAPAGSGKTELLTQRFLVLLAHVKQPEEILAITFTKKSAAEMRSRIINALGSALHEPNAQAPHEKLTWVLAKRVQKRSLALQWNLLANPNRLRIQTMDSFNAYLTKQCPILSHFGATPEIADNLSALYREAVQEFLSHLEENVPWSSSIAQLLRHMDNDLNELQKLLINMLAKRDQWLPYVAMNASEFNLRDKLQSHLSCVTEDILKKCHARFPKHLVAELLYLAKIVNLMDLDSLPKTRIFNKPEWLALSQLLLTAESEWRKKADKKMGFPAASSLKNKQEKEAANHNKMRFHELIASLRPHEELRSALEELRLAPHHEYEESQWDTLDALQKTLRIAVAQLKLTFQQYSKIDYIENAQAALLALGFDDAPTDMTLALDYQIKHILIDEFQDTSHSQYRLVQKLTSGWNKDDGRTLFVVGDPMQSIYRFREAEVGLFIRTRQHGLGGISLEPITLCVNFRSHPAIISWVNNHFQDVFPSFEDISMGAVTYSKSYAHNEADIFSQEKVTLHPFLNAEPPIQANAVVDIIRQLKETNPKDTIAILVRSRSHLTSLIAALKKAGVPYRAIDIDPLDTRPVIQDLMALTRALLHPADRIAWLAILRAPWCGLSLSDLLLVSGKNPAQSISERLQSEDVFLKLSCDGRDRLGRILPLLQKKISQRLRYPLRVWLENTWTLLGGPACVTLESDLNDAQAFFNLLESLDPGGNFTVDDLTEHVKQLFASPNNEADNTLQIMTIHNSKGLEFDCVILPHLERKPPNNEKQLLLWMEYPREENANGLIIAPIHAAGKNKDSIYQYIQRQHVIKDDYETGRLLYVAATRTKKNLHMLFSLESDDTQNIGKPISKSLLGKLWPSIEKEVMETIKPAATNIREKDFLDKPKKPVMIHRLSLDWKNPVTKDLMVEPISYHKTQSGFLLPDNNPRYIGILIHQLLQYICQLDSSFWENKSEQCQNDYLKQELTHLGMLQKDIPSAIDLVKKAIKNTLQEALGQWIIKPHHHAANELRLTAVIEGQVKSYVIDRTFVDEDDSRWIIDYKTSTPDNENLSDFIDAEHKKYAKQMQLYSTALAEIDSRPIRLGLYFPLIPFWREISSN